MDATNTGETTSGIPDPLPMRHWVALIRAHQKDAEARAPQLNKWINWYHSRDMTTLDPGTRAVLAHTSEDVDDGSDLRVHNNYVYSFIDQMVANICPQNPQVTVDSVEELHDIAKNRGQLINHSFRQDKLFMKLDRLSRWSALSGQGFTKLVWDERRRVPKVLVLHPLRVWYDHTVEFRDSRYVIEVVTLTEEQAKARFTAGIYDESLKDQLKFSSFPSWLYDEPGDSSNPRQAARDAVKWTVIYEVYDRFRREVLHISADIESSPLNPEAVGHPFDAAEPYHDLVFNPDFITSRGVSDVQLIERALDRLNEIDTLELEHAHASIPTAILNEALVEDPVAFKEAYNNSGDPGDMISFRSKQARAINDILSWTQAPSMPPDFKISRERIVEMITSTLGIPQYMRGGHSGGEVATEFALINEGVQTRNGRRRAVLDEHIEDLSANVIKIWAQYMGDARVLAMVDRMSRGSIITREDIVTDNEAEDPWSQESKFIYQSLSHSPTENHRLVQLQHLQTYLEFFMASPEIDQSAFVRKLLELLGLAGLQNSPAQVQQAMTAAQGQPPPGQQPPQGGGEGETGPDTLATGAVIGGTDETLLPPGARIMADQPKAEF